MNWDQYFLQMARAVSAKSKDPSTKVGCVITRLDNTVASTGWNGFPRGVPDDKDKYEDRDYKYQWVVHSEPNAIINARADLRGCTIYTWPFPPCMGCAKLIAQAGIRRVVAPPPSQELKDRWGNDLALAENLFQTVGVLFEFYRGPME